MKTHWLTIIVLVLAFIGLADAWYLGDAALTGSHISCDIAILNGCDTVASSPYSHLLGIPLGVYGALFYAAVFMIAAIALVLPHRHIYMWLFYLSIIGTGISVILAIIQVALIRVGCISLALFGISLIFFRRFRKDDITEPAIPQPI
jgi:uncharacterized membrane protein